VDAHTNEVDGRKITAVIAVGGQPLKPDLPGMEHAITARCLHLQQLPKRLAIIGDGYIGVEFSSMMNALGVQVTLMETDKLILGFDDVHSDVQRA